MNILQKVYCRTFQTVLRIALPVLPYREPKRLKSIENLALTLKEKKIDPVLIVTDSMLTQLGLLQYVTEHLEAEGRTYYVYNETTANPTDEQIEAAATLYREHKCKGIIALGGGSPIDCAKGTGVRVVRPRTPLKKMKGILKVMHPLPPIFAIPTTAGTGSEVTLAAVITDAKTHHKYTICDFPLIPKYAVHDPKMTESLPKALVATTGLDALTHAVEVYIGRSMTKYTKGAARKAVKLIFENLRNAYEDQGNVEARKAMLKAAYLAGNAFSQSYVGYIHAVAHSLGGQYGIPHGLANATLLPIILREYGEAVERPLAELAILTGLAGKEQTVKEAAECFIQAIEEMNKEFGIGKTFPELLEEDIPKLARYAAKEANPLYPVPVLMNKKELEHFYRLVLEKEE